MAFIETFQLQPRSPLNFDLSCQVFIDGSPLVRTYMRDMFSQVLQIRGHLVMVQVIECGTPEAPCLRVTLKSNLALTTQIKQAAQDMLIYIFNLNFDLCAFYEEVQTDPIMHKITQQLWGFRFPTTPTVFEGLVDAIVEQQISIKVARTIEERLAKRLGSQLKINDVIYSAFPTAQQINDASLSDVQGCGLSQRKAEYICNVANYVVEGKLDLEALKSNSDSAGIVGMLDELRGVGVWTAELTLLRGMQRWDVLPADDFGIKRVISTYYCNGGPLSAVQAREVARVWGRWQGLAAFYLILAESRGIRV
ncbi:MAG: DNA-3-methyladenine glycosylase 2 family protein [Nitrososphaerota archaeon]|jgi:DNA-3-methyladenine glycosylase II|nr:DNA-3-methyladenine glycosylase 2 family protein [Nitrososphaerota archaeon]